DLNVAIARPEFQQFDTLGENVLTGQGSMTTGGMDTAWMQSSSHRSNIVAPGFTAVGIGVVCASDGKVWVTQAFARKTGVTAPTSAPAAVDPIVAGTGGGSCTQAPTTT